MSKVFEGGSPMTTKIARKIISVLHHKSENDKMNILTPMKKKILEGLSKGLRFKEIAVELHISYETVRTHTRNNIY